MKPIERISLYLQFKNISPHSFEKKIGLSNGYFSKQLRNLGSVGSDILIKIDEHYTDLNILWVLNGQGQMISTNDDASTTGEFMRVDEYLNKYEVENKKMFGFRFTFCPRAISWRLRWALAACNRSGSASSRCAAASTRRS